MAKESNEDTTSPQLLLVGTWVKTTKSECDEKYPARLEFSERGLYFDRQGETQSLYHPVWDVGRYDVYDANHIKMSTSNDAEVEYEISLSNDVLTVKDSAGCEFKYRRLK